MKFARFASERLVVLFLCCHPFASKAKGNPGEGRTNGSIYVKAPVSIDLADLIKTFDPPSARKLEEEEPIFRGSFCCFGSVFDEDEINEAYETATQQDFDPDIQNIAKPTGQAPKLLSSFDSMDASSCCIGASFSATVPPDPDIAVGPNHIVTVVNAATFEVYDKEGQSLVGPVGLRPLFLHTPECNNRLFDPDVVYDEYEDR